jgi:serine/threonine-protein kinase
MAHVWLARAVGLAGFEKLVVLKTILPALAENAQFTEMFINEGRIAAVLNHPNCVQIFDLGREADVLFIAMEYIEGFSLSRVMRRCAARGLKPPIELLCRVVMDSLSGLDYAHRLTGRDGKPMHVVHRDISPDNLLVAFTGQTKVVDFGIAKAVAEPGRQGGTRTGTVKGKFSYMAPEYLRGEPIDGRADVFATGVLLYRLLTGKKPFTGATDAMITMAVLTHEPPAPSTLSPELPPSLDPVVAKALAKDPAARFQSARAMRTAIEAALGSVPDAEAVGSWLQELWPHGDEERAALEALAAATHADESSDPVLEAVISEDVDLGFTRGSVSSASASSPSTATPQPVTRSSGSLIAGALALAVVGGIGWFTLVRGRAPVPPGAQPVARVERGPDEPKAPVPAPAKGEPDPARPVVDPEPESESPKAPKGGGGWLELSANPAVSVYVKGKAVGRTPVKVPLPSGKQTVRLVDSGAGIEKTLPVVIRAGATTTTMVTFAKGKLDLRVSPWAQVKLDGRSLGNTPIPVQELYEGSHLLELTNPELGKTKKLEVRVAGGETKLVRESLE